MISIIIPTFNVEKTIDRVLKRVRSLNFRGEIIVADGGSSDKTLELVRKYDVKIVHCNGGSRACDMNIGAKEAKGEILLFLHGDVLLPDNSFEIIRDCLKDKRVVGGGFYKKYWDHNFLMLGNILFAMFRIRLFKLFWGNEAVFSRRSVFENMNGFMQWPLMEDVDFSRRLVKKGKVVALNKMVSVSRRRYEKQGTFRQNFRNVKVLLGYFLGVRPSRLISWYKGK